MTINSKKETDAVAELTYVEHDRDPIVNFEGPIKPDSQRAHRALAFHFVYAADRSDYSTTLEEIVAGYKAEFGLVLEDDAFAITMARGAITHREELDALIAPILENWKLDRLSCATRLILRLALWERKYTDTPDTIVINEAVELARAFAEEDAYRLVNGVLDQGQDPLVP